MDLGGPFIWGRARVDPHDAASLLVMVGVSIYLLILGLTMLGVLLGHQGGLAIIALVATFGPIMTAITLLPVYGIIIFLNYCNLLAGLIIIPMGFIFVLPAASLILILSEPLGLVLFILGPVFSIWFWRLAARPMHDEY